ncbi:MAG: glycosyl hydrolase family protein [Winogradskyella sp.]|uniref:family 16 glycosylhydrolase n=1 Tax=Winogradskyella sp. TaxID=1883156 RepID=UPI000F3EB63E|nr:family 16 glycosylhydrolase [Winogradskyella sp.]RNC86433.1 MAG: glycosyl hydrolase family protein [Winogradskyella sp.]
MKHIITLLFCCLSLALISQQTPIDFSDSSDNFSVWGGSTFTIVPSPTDASNLTGEFFRSASTGSQGHFIDLSSPIDLDAEDVITLRFYAFDPNSHTIVVRLENGTNADVEVSAVASSNQNNWSDLSFDFSTVGGSGTYSRLVIRIDDGSSIPGAFRIDDINDGSVATDPHALDVIYDDLVWSDEFDSSSGNNPIDDTKWHHQVIGPNGGQWFNGEQQHYTDRIDNSYIEDGFLNIVAKKELGYEQDGVTLDYTSARLNSKFAFTYGRIDVRAKLPAGDGTWPAIWTLGKNINEVGTYWQPLFGDTTWPACGELDVMEHGLGATNHVSSAIHTPSSSGNTVNTQSFTLTDVANNFHVYSMNWSPNQITFMIDGVGFYTYNPAVKNASTWPFDEDQFILLNVAMGGFAGTIDPTFTESNMVIDYVRVYQNASLSTDDFDISEVRVFPNPANDKIQIVSNIDLDYVEVYNTFGQKINTISSNFRSVDVSNLANGIYILKIYSQGKSTTKKMVIN